MDPLPQDTALSVGLEPVRTIAHSTAREGKVNDTMSTEKSAPPPAGIVVRAAEWIGTAFGRWQRRRAAARDDSFVDQWKTAWNEGCLAHKAGKAERDVPYLKTPRRDAWIAGWRWAAGAPSSDQPKKVRLKADSTADASL